MLESFLNLVRTIAVETLWKSLLLFVAAGTALLVMKSASASARSLVWRLVLLGLLLLPALSLAVPPLPITLPGNSAPLPLSRIARTIQSPAQASGPGFALSGAHEGGVPALSASPAATDQPHSSVSSVQALPDSPVSRHIPTARPASSWSVLLRWAKAHSMVLLCTGWLSVSILLLGKMLADLLAIRHIEDRALPAPPRLQAAFTSLAAETGILRPIRIRVADLEQSEVSPMTWGFLRPLILLPADADAWPEQRLRAVLLHELSHILRHDWTVQIAVAFARAVYWFHPLVWLMAQQVRRESEVACDDRVLSYGVNGHDYAAHLLEIVRMRKSTNALPSAAISMAQPSLLEARLRAVLDSRRSRRPLSRTAVLLSFLCLTIVILPLAAARVAANHAPALLSQPNVLLPESAPSESPVSGNPTSVLPGASLPTPLLAAAVSRVSKLPANPAIAWGKEVRGLQAGLQIAGGPSSVTIGQHIEFLVHLRNVGKKPLTLKYPAIKEKITANPFVWNAITTNDRNVSIYRENTSIETDRMTEVALQPGEEKTLPGDALKFHISTMGDSAVIEQTVFLVPGTVSFQAVPFPLAHYRDDWLQKVITGILQLTVMADPTAGNSALTASAVSKVPAGLKGIQWGVPERGLEAGVRIEGAQHPYSQGQTVHVTLFVRNTTKQRVPFAYSYRPPRVWDSAGKPVETSRNEPLLGGLPGATLMILPPGETLAIPSEIKIIGAVGERESVYSSLVEPKTGKYRVGQMFQIPWAELKNTESILAKNDPIYRTNVTLLNAKGQPHTVRAVITAAEGVGISTNRDHAPTPDIGAANSDSGALWTGFDEFEVAAQGGVGLNNIQWGKTSDGLQAGIRILGAQNHFNPGGRVLVECYIRNTTDHEIAFTYTAGYYSAQLPTIIDTANPGIERSVKGVLLTGLDAALAIILKPGETVVFPHPGVGLGERQEPVPAPNNLPKGLEQYPYLEQPTPGSYTIKQTFVYSVTTVEKVRDLMARSHNKPLIIEPMSVKLIKRDGATYEGEVTVIPAYEEKNILLTGEAPFNITAKTPQ